MRRAKADASRRFDQAPLYIRILEALRHQPSLQGRISFSDFPGQNPSRIRNGLVDICLVPKAAFAKFLPRCRFAILSRPHEGRILLSLLLRELLANDFIAKSGRKCREPRASSSSYPSSSSPAVGHVVRNFLVRNRGRMQYRQKGAFFRIRGFNLWVLPSTSASHLIRGQQAGDRKRPRITTVVIVLFAEHACSLVRRFIVKIRSSIRLIHGFLGRIVSHTPDVAVRRAAFWRAGPR